ncbi:MAG: DUF1016 domain-containing protein [Elusimicrobia bacterium]|nr:DUF1016 domain-containing protein [Elusimicrobiota bacterium]
MKPKKVIAHVKNVSAQGAPDATDESSFAEVVNLIEEARTRAYQAVNTELICLYWKVGEYINRKLDSAEWGDGVVDQLARHIARTMAGLRGFSRENLFRMRLFYQTYAGDKKVSPLVTQLPWTHHLIIMGQCKRPEEREFYLRLAIRERWGKRELERQLRGALFERAVLNPPKVSPRVRQTHPAAVDVFKDSYFVEFLQLPKDHTEADLHQGLVNRLKDFLVELGRDVKKPHENPAIGVLLCASKDQEVVEYALSRSLSPALIAEYRTKLPEKQFLQAKLHEFYRHALEGQARIGSKKRKDS